MSYIAPRTFVTAELATAAMFNENRDNIIDLNARTNVVSDYVAALDTSASDPYANLGSAGPAFSMVTGSIALIGISAILGNNTTSCGARMSFAVSGATTIAAGDFMCIAQIAHAGGFSLGMSGVFVASGLNAGLNTFTAKYRRDLGGIASFQERRIWGHPGTKLS